MISDFISLQGIDSEIQYWAFYPDEVGSMMVGNYIMSSITRVNYSIKYKLQVL